jgi:hypothetical protein
MPPKKCNNPLCKEENPEFYKGRSICKKCFNKECNERRKKKFELLDMYESKESKDEMISILKQKDKEIEELKNLVRTIAHKLEKLSV